MGKVVQFESQNGKVVYKPEVLRGKKFKAKRSESKAKIKCIGLSAIILFMTAAGVYGATNTAYNAYLNNGASIPEGYVEWHVDSANYFEMNRMLNTEEKDVFRKEINELKQKAKKEGYDLAPGGPVDIPNLISVESPEYLKYQEINERINSIIKSNNHTTRMSIGKNARALAEGLVPFPSDIYNNSDDFMKKRIKYWMEIAYQRATEEIINENGGKEPVGGVNFVSLPDEYFEGLGQNALLKACLDVRSLKDRYVPENYDFDTILKYCDSFSETKGVIK